MNTVHLTADQLDDHLIGDLAADAQSHLDTCEHCQARVAEVAAPLTSFREVTLAWAERRSATMPVQPLAKPSRTTARMGWATACAAVLAVSVAVPVMHHEANGTHTVATETASTEQIARDNQMLNDIDRELDASTSTPAAYGLQASAAEQPRAHTARVQN